MIPNITKGDRPVGLMNYLLGPGRRNEHTDPHLITGSATIMAWFDDAQLSEDHAVSIAQELDLNRSLFDVVMPQHVWHCSLSLRADERQLTDQEWADIAAQFMDDMDFTDTGNKAPCQWVAVHHGTSIAGNDHIHIVASRVRADGTKWHDGADFHLAQKAARKLEQQYGLIQLGQHSERGYKPAEKQHGTDREPVRFRLERTVRACAVAAGDESQFVRAMRRAGLLVHPRFADGGQSVVSGYSVAERPPKGMRPVWFGGGKLAKDLTLPSLRTRWPDEPMLAQEAAEEWIAAKRHRRIVHPDPGGTVLDEETARRLAGDLKKVRRQLTKVPSDDQQSWAHVAREASGVLAAWSKVTEEENGPLGRTARVLARSAHRNGVRIQDPLPVSLRMAGTTAFLLAATSAPSPMAQALIMQQMVRMTRALYDMHRDNKELRETTLIADAIERQLAEFAAPLPDVPKTLAASRAQAGPTRDRGSLNETTGPTARTHIEHRSTATGMEL
ncbi:relaxase/mobilization nuclease domain-containing protein [Kocuria sp. CPCC 205258]|uniref:relaxase/mobilization nuclease domain-containing protein n=1 Tax=Kocuria sp. CPCC 205258 TaxID=3073552 RepID=UPI0034D75AC1